MLARRHQNPLRRGVYEALYHDLAVEHPGLWSRNGPRETVVPRGVASRVRWWLLRHWFAPNKTIAPGSSSRTAVGGHGPGGFDTGESQLGYWAHLKRALASRWLAGIVVAPSSVGESLLGAGEIVDDAANAVELGEAGVGAEFGAITELLALAQPVAVADGNPEAARLSTPPLPVRSVSARRRFEERFQKGSRRRKESPSGSDGGLERLGSGQSGYSGIMVDEKAASSDEEREGDKKQAKRAYSDGSREASGRVEREAENTPTGARPRSDSRRSSGRLSSGGDRLSVPIFPGRASEQQPEWE